MADETAPHGRVLNEATRVNVLGLFMPLLSIIVVLLLFVWVRRPHQVITPLAFLPFALIGGLIFFGGLYNLCWGAKTVTLTRDGLLVERWISRLFHRDQTRLIAWRAIQRVIYRQTPGRFRVHRKLLLYLPDGVHTFTTDWFDDRQLQYVKNHLTERLGRGKVHTVTDRSFRLTTIPPETR
jgi:hypothetical protein